jgi:hypothetical protein
MLHRQRRSLSPSSALEKSGQFPATPRVPVATGFISEVGEYQLLHSRDFRGGMCIGLLLEKGDDDGGDVLTEGCGGPED